MIKHEKLYANCDSTVVGRGLLNTIINKLPFELHIPGYQYCGPGTKLNKRLARGDPGINPLDRACKEHDIAYSNSKDTTVRNQADLQLAEKAWQRVKATDSKPGERINAWFVTNAMKANAKLGMGVKSKENIKNKKKIKRINVLQHLISKSRAAVKSKKPKNMQSAIKVALAAAKSNVKGKQEKLPRTRVIPVPKVGGVLPFLLPLFAGLSAIGGLSGGAAGIAKAINDAKEARKQLAESERHNKKMEVIAMGKGLFLKPYRKGLGLYLKPKNF
jgi:hypothetical protein